MIVLTGGSMGGQQSLALAGLRPDPITAVLVCVPAGADTNADLRGRKAGYPNWPPDNPDAMQTALYFDTANFTSRIKARVMAGLGFIDTVSPPAGIWAATRSSMDSCAEASSRQRSKRSAVFESSIWRRAATSKPERIPPLP
jgi:cephalosporin-C deacetylase-like acetyl esterase